MSVKYMNPDGLHKNPAFSQVVVASGQMGTVYIGGQNAVDSSGNVVGKGDIVGRLSRPLRTWRLRFPLRELSWRT
jgi:enamine deaminase RidA (YjgF/YER057c/UK114 family)